MDQNPLVSVIIPAYNAASYIKETIDSVLAQTYSPVEIVVVDDGSTDDTGKVADRYARQSSDCVKVIHQPNTGISGARNAGFAVASGKLVCFLDADDIFLPEKIARQVAFMLSHPQFDATYVNMKHFRDNDQGRLYQHRYFLKEVADPFREFLERMYIPFTPVMIKRETIVSVGAFDSTMRHSEDWDFWLRFLRKGHAIGFLNEDLVRFRLSSNSLSRMDNQWDMKEHILRLFTKLFDSMSNSEREEYHADSILRRLHAKAAIAHLAVGRRLEFREHLQQACANTIQRVCANFTIGASTLIPINFLQAVIRALWRLKQRSLFW